MTEITEIGSLVLGHTESKKESGNKIAAWTVEGLLERLGGSDMAVIAFNGGWGIEPLSADAHFGQNLKEIALLLKTKGYKPSLIDDPRVETIPEILFPKKNWLSQHAAAVIKEVLNRRKNLRVLFIGLSNGANFAEKVIAGLGNSAQNQVWALEFGRPTWPWVKYKEVVNPGNTGEVTSVDDFLRKWDRRTFLKALKQAKIPPKIEWYNGMVRARFDVPGHIYDWPSIKDQVTIFIDKMGNSDKEIA